MIIICNENSVANSYVMIINDNHTGGVPSPGGIQKSTKEYGWPLLSIG